MELAILGQSALDGIGGGFSPVAGTSLVEDALHVSIDSTDADEKFFSNLPVGFASSN